MIPATAIDLKLSKVEIIEKWLRGKKLYANSTISKQVL